MLELFMMAMIGLSDNSAVRWQTGIQNNLHSDITVGAVYKNNLKLQLNTEVWAVKGEINRGFSPILANYGLELKYSKSFLIFDLRHNCLHSVYNGVYKKGLGKDITGQTVMYEQNEWRGSVGIQINQKYF